MAVGWLAAASLSFGSIPAHAEDVPQVQPPNTCNHLVPSAWGRQTYSAGPGQRMQCIRKWSAIGGPGRWPDADVALSDSEKQQGFVVTGGGCEQVAPLCNYQMIVSKPLRDDGWHCGVGDIPGDSAADQKRVQAFLVACRITTVPKELGAPVEFGTPQSGELVTLARNGIAFRKRIRHDVRLCNSGPMAMHVFWNVSDHDAAPNPFPESRQIISAGECLQLKTPASVMLENQGGQSGRAFGAYQWFPQDSFERDGEVLPVTATYPKPPPPPANPEPKTFSCAPLSAADQAKNADYAKFCEIKLPKLDNYRICFGKGFVVRSDGGSDWAQSLIATIVDRKLLGVTRNPNDQANPKWNPALEETCRDMFNIKQFNVMVGPAKPGDVWDASKVLAIKASVQTIP
ncbi:MAG: hypothetical protein KDJ20_18680 [Hyphomicrobiales bacterium]|nr:hypothetical protein [Hyphomicrobiales bacterium]MCC2106233.1 hypothetical protein [Hyphomicrobiales bacterium]